MPDDNGYPEEEELERIKKWKVDKSNFDEFMDYVRSIWHWPEFVKKVENRYVLVTGGWSGNESVIGAMKENRVFWLMYWQSSERGGRYVFSNIKTEIEEPQSMKIGSFFLNVKLNRMYRYFLQDTVLFSGLMIGKDIAFGIIRNKRVK